MAKRSSKTHRFVDPEPRDSREPEPARRTVEVLEPFFVNGAMQLPGDVITNMPEELAYSLVIRGKANYQEGR
jgi:hypothetical protein